MLAFKVEEFDKMIDELFFEKVVKYDAFLKILEKTVYGYLVHKASGMSDMTTSKAYDDIYHNVFQKLRLTSFKGFFYKYGDDPRVNDGPEAFQKYLYTVARNAFFDYVNQNRSKHVVLIDPEDPIVNVSVPDTTAEVIEKLAAIERLSASFDCVIESKNSVYKILTWLAHCMFISEGFTPIEAKRILIDMFSDEPLEHMYYEIYAMSKRISWLELSEHQRDKLERALERPHKDGRSMRDIKLKELYMAKGAMASVSDWVNKINTYVKEKTGDEAGKK